MDRILKTHFDKFRDLGQLPPELCETIDCTELKLFEDKELLKKWRDAFKGIRHVDEVGNELFGAVDNLLEKEGKLIVLDYKTRGFPLRENTHEYSRLQMDIYNYLLRKNGYETEDYSFLLFYIPSTVTSTGEVVFDTKLVKMDVDVESVEDVWRQALDLLNGVCPEKVCVWCDGKGKRNN